MNFKRYLKGAWEGADFWDKKENNDQGQQRAVAQPAKLPQSDKPNRGLVGVLKGAANQVNPFDGGRTWDTSRRNVTPGTQNKFKINDNTPGFQFSNNSLTRGLSRGWDQANILDSGRSWKTRTPDDIQRNQSGLSQAGKTLLPASGKFLNTAGLAGEQVINTTRMLAAQASNNQEALRNSIKASDDDYERYTKPGAGIFGTGTYFRSADEAKSGDFKTVAKRIGGGIAETGFEVASLGVGSFAGKKALDTAGKAGIKKAIVSQAPALAKTAVLNAGQAGASAYNQDANARGIAVSALTGAGLGTAADIGLGLGGAVAAKQAKAVATKAMPIAKDIAQESSKLFRDQAGFIANPLQPNEPIKPKIAQPSARPDPMADLPDLVVTRLSEQKTKKIPDLSTKDYNNSLKEFVEEVQAYNKLKNAQEPPIQQADKIDPLESLKQEARKLDEQVRSYDMKKNFKGFRESDDARRLVELESKLQESNKTISRLDNPVDKVTVSQIENMGRKAILEGNVSKADLVKQFNKMGKEKFPSNQKRYIDDTYGSVEAYYDDVIAKGEAGIVEQYTQFAQMPTSPKFEDFYNRTVLNRNKTGLNGNEPKINKVERKITETEPKRTEKATQSQPPKSPLAKDPLESLKQEAKPFVIPKTNPTDVTKLLNKDLDPLPTSPVNGKYVAEEVKNVLRGAQTKERGFISTIKSSDKTPSSVKSIETGTYSIKSDKQRIADAQAFIRENPAKARELALNPKSDMDVTIGNQLIDHYIATGQHKAMQEVVSGMAESGTELGRAIHAFADYDKTTPGGAVKFAEAAIRKYNKANPDKQLALQPEQVEALVNTAKQIQEMPEGRQRNIASHELINQVNELIPSTFADKALTVWKAGLLTSMRTTARNVFGNTIHGVAEIAKDVPASLADRLMALKTGNRSKTFTVKGAAQGIGEGLSHAKDMMKHGYDPTEALAGYDIKAVTWGKGPVEQGLKKYTDLVFRSLGAQDQVFYHSAFNRSLYDQALTSAKNTAKKGDDNFVDNLVKNPTEGMKVQAVIDASKATFKDENMLRDLATKVKRGLGKTEGGKVVSELVMPFVGVPSSVASQMLSYSPAGFVKGLATGSKAVRQKNSILQRQASHEIGRGTVGTGLMGLGAYLTSRGLMTGNPKDQKEAEQWKLEGKQPNSVMIGGKWRSINSVGPEALLTLAGSKLESGRQNNAGMGELAGQLGKDFTQQTFLQGVQGPLNAINDPGRYGSSYVSGQVGSIIPNIVKDTAKAMDDKQRQINSPIDALKAGTPILRNNLLPKLDVLGNELKQEPSGLNNFIDLFNSKTPIKNSVIDETKKFSSADLSITPSALDKSLKESGVSIKLTPEQRTSLQKAIGTQTQAMWKETIKSPRYQSLSIEEQSKAMSKMYSDARQAEIRKFVADNQLGQYSQDFSGKPGKIDKGAKAILSGTSSVDKYLRTDTGSTIKDRYDALKDEISDKNNGWSDIKRIEKEREFAKLSVQKEYSDDLIDLYGWSKDRIKSYVDGSKNPDKTLGKLIAYEDAMIKAGMLSKSKLRDKYGNLSLSSTGNSGSKGGKGRKSSKSSGGKRARKFDYKIDGFAKTAKSGKSLRQLLNEAKMRKTA